MTLYQVLGASPSATHDEITRAFRAIARVCHPDVAAEDPAKLERFRRANEAYETLKDEERRSRYDLAFEPIGSVAALFRRRQGVRLVATMLESAPKAPKPGVDTASVAEVPPEVLAEGGVVEVDVLGTLQTVTIPPGSQSRRFGLIASAGEAGVNGGDHGDHLVVLVPKSG